MAYFANGDEGDWYEAQYCNNCIFERDSEKGECCPVWMLHLLWNYEQFDNEALDDNERNCSSIKALALLQLIPRGLGPQYNKQCSFFFDKNNLHALVYAADEARKDQLERTCMDEELYDLLVAAIRPFK